MKTNGNQQAARKPEYHGVEDLEVLSWSPGAADENIPCTQVHIQIGVPAIGGGFVIRLKSREVCDLLIAALTEHRDFVFGAPPTDESKG